MTNNISGSSMSMNNGIISYTTRLGSNNFNPFMTGSVFDMGNIGNGVDFGSGLNIGMMIPFLMMQNMPIMNTNGFNFNGLNMFNPNAYRVPEQKRPAEQPKVAKAEEKKPAESKKAEETKDEDLLKEATDIAGDIYDATDGVGTKVDKLQAAVNRINKDNVMEVMSSWEKDYQSADGLLEQIQHDTSGEIETQLERHIMKALCEKAKEVGLSDEATATEKIVNSELSSSFWVSRDKVVIKLNDLKDEIEQKQNKNKNTQTVGTIDDNYGECEGNACTMYPYMPMLSYYG